jgi:pSer/pThr/pTyr-binding forkhead associated (FHA) protein
MVAPQGRPCPQCGAPVPLGNRFCGACGSRTDEGQAPAPHAPFGEGAPAAAKTLFFGAMQTPGRAKLILIKGQGMDGMTYYLQSTEHIAGRSEGPIQFNEVDPLLSPRHASFCYKDTQLMVKDLDSTNGVFLRARAPVKLRSGDTFLVGEQLLRVERCTLDEAPIHDDVGTYFYASPRTPCAFKLIQLLHGGAEGASFCPAKGSVRIGRDGNDLNFPDDHFISGTHAEVTATPDGFTLTDLGSKNGTFHRITSESPLHHGDYVFIGQQLLRVEIT